MFLFIMFAQDVFGEVVGEIANDGMHMVGIVLRVVIFDEQHRTLNAVIVSGAGLKASRPRKAQVFNSRLFDFFHQAL